MIKITNKTWKFANLVILDLTAKELTAAQKFKIEINIPIPKGLILNLSTNICCDAQNPTVVNTVAEIRIISISWNSLL